VDWRRSLLVMLGLAEVAEESVRQFLSRQRISLLQVVCSAWCFWLGAALPNCPVVFPEGLFHKE